MKEYSETFLTRWFINSVGLWLAFKIFGTGFDDTTVKVGIVGFIIAGLVFSVANSYIKPIIVALSLPAILLTLGLFVLVINGTLVYLSIKIAPGFSMTFTNSIFAGLLLGLINYIVSTVLLLRSVEYK